MKALPKEIKELLKHHKSDIDPILMKCIKTLNNNSDAVTIQNYENEVNDSVGSRRTTITLNFKYYCTGNECNFTIVF